MKNAKAFQKLSPGEIYPSGWMKRQLEIQAAGLAGNLDKVWPDVKDSGWLGGKADSWERLPCWLDGFVPLAYLLKNEDMISRAEKYINEVISRQCEDGWLTPTTDRKNCDLWAEIVMDKVLAEYAEYSGDERATKAAEKSLLCMYSHVRNCTVHGWASARWFEAIFPILHVYERTKNKQLIGFAKELYCTSFDYEKMADTLSFAKPKERKYWNFELHNVNVAMALKQKALYSLISGEKDKGFAKKFLNKILSLHRVGNGHFSGDECLSGHSPIHGTELCGVAETMFSAETLLEITGDAYWGDVLENLAFNLLPAALTPDMWAHQYDQQVNQIECSAQSNDDVPFNSNNGEAHLFGLEPHYGCCTANHGQGFPKFAERSVMRCKNGLVILSPTPAEVRACVGGENVELSVISDYPFKSRFEIVWKQKNHAGSTPGEALKIRIPSYAKLSVNGRIYGGKYATLAITKPEETFSCEYIYSPRLVKTDTGMFVLRNGALLYSVPIKYRSVTREYTAKTSAWASYNICTINEIERKFPYCDYEFFPISKWNYAFSDKPRFDYKENAIGDYPFSPENPPCEISCEMKTVKWGRRRGMCAEKPKNTVATGDERVTLIPYGATILRMTEMPEATGKTSGRSK